MNCINAETALSIVDAIQDAFTSAANDIESYGGDDSQYAVGYLDGASAASAAIYKAIRKEAEKDD